MATIEHRNQGSIVSQRDLRLGVLAHWFLADIVADFNG
jgi:hypothetical protein